MEKKVFTQVVIDGKIYNLGGYESEDYIHQVASYLNNKITEMKTLDGYRRLPASSRNLMLDLNAADDYFKARNQAARLETELSDKDKELYEAKHEIVSLQVKMEECQKQITSLQEEASDYQKQIIDLEARLSQSSASNQNRNNGSHNRH